jgi:hypothetical protein
VIAGELQVGVGLGAAGTRRLGKMVSDGRHVATSQSLVKASCR